jgi:hypothetical protein
VQVYVFDCSHCFIVRRCLISKGLELQSIAEHTVNGRPPSWQLVKHQRLLLFQVPLFLFRTSLFKFISMKLSLPNGQHKGFLFHLEVLSLLICAPLHTLTLVLCYRWLQETNQAIDFVLRGKGVTLNYSLQASQRLCGCPIHTIAARCFESYCLRNIII